MTSVGITEVLGLFDVVAVAPKTAYMEMFTVYWGRTWWVRLLGRNHLVRSSDRLETCVAALAVIAAIVAIPFAAAFGSAVGESRFSTYVEQARARHQTGATALETATLHAQVYSQSYTVRAKWAAAGSVHRATVSAPGMVRAGEKFDIWIDDQGGIANPPTPPSEAATEAVGWGVLSWSAGLLACSAVLYGLHRGLDRARYADWDRELDALAGNDGGRARQEPGS